MITMDKSVRKGEMGVKLSRFMSLHALVFIALGIAFALYGPLMMAMFGTARIGEGDALLYWYTASFARLFGAALFGLGLLIWAVRGLAAQGITSAETRRGIVFSLLLSSLLGLFVTVTQQVAIWETPTGWAAVLVFLLLSGGYAFFLVRTE